MTCTYKKVLVAHRYDILLKDMCIHVERERERGLGLIITKSKISFGDDFCNIEINKVPNEWDVCFLSYKKLGNI